MKQRGEEQSPSSPQVGYIVRQGGERAFECYYAMLEILQFYKGIPFN